MRANARAHLFRAHGFRHVIDAPDAKAPHDMLAFRQRRHEDDRKMLVTWVLFDPRAGLEAVHRGHYRVEQHDVRRDPRQTLQCRLAA